ncbi:MAG: hypothetical protein JOZ72_12260 [Alphaproteobacteria bacterium]|nr:hypothetical protein [Alphaproteobacteria bacterium]
MGAYGQHDAYHGFVQGLDGGVALFDVPGAASTLRLAMNGKGWITGVYGVEVDQKVFIRAPDSTFHLTDFQDAPSPMRRSFRER